MMLEGPFVETHGRIVDYFERRIEAGDLSHDDPKMAAEYFISIIKAGRHIPLVFSQPADTSSASLRAIASGAVAIFLGGLKNRAPGKAQPAPRATAAPKRPRRIASGAGD